MAYYERIHWAQWVEERADEHRQAGSRKPYALALIDLLELTEEPEVVGEIIADEKRFARIQKQFKKKRLISRQELRVAKKMAVIRRGWLRLRLPEKKAVSRARP